MTLAVLHDTDLRIALDYAGVAVFAATGALAAAWRGYDIVTFAFFAAITGIGGGTLRDLLLGAPVFWVSDPGYVGVSAAAAGLVWAMGERLARVRSLLWLDAVGLAAYAVVGASKAADWGAPPLVSVVMGVLSASFGGVVRDVLAGEPSVLLRKEIYVTAALAGAGVFVLLRLVGAPDWAAAALGMATAFVLRAGALARGWTLPGYDQAAVVAAPPPAPAVPLTPAVPLAAPPPPVDTAPPAAGAAMLPPAKPRVRKPRAAAAPASDGAPAPALPAPKPRTARPRKAKPDQT